MSDSPPENSPIVVQDDALPGQSSRRKQRLRRAVIVSIVAHLIGVIALLCWYIPANKSQLNDQSTATNESSNDTSPRNPPAPVKPAAPEGDEVSEDQIQKSLESQIEAVKQIPDEQKLDQLEKISNGWSPSPVQNLPPKLRLRFPLHWVWIQTNTRPKNQKILHLARLT